MEQAKWKDMNVIATKGRLIWRFYLCGNKLINLSLDPLVLLQLSCRLKYALTALLL